MCLVSDLLLLIAFFWFFFALFSWLIVVFFSWKTLSVDVFCLIFFGRYSRFTPFPFYFAPRAGWPFARTLILRQH